MGRDLIYLAPHRWDTVMQRSQQLTAALAARHTVLYVEPVAHSIVGRVRRLVQRHHGGPWRSRLTRRGERLWTYTPQPLLPLSMDVRGVNQLAHALAARPLNSVLAGLGFRAPLLIVGWPLAGDWVGRLGEGSVVYDCMDDFPAFPQAPRRRRLLAASERELAARAALITVTSVQLARKWRAGGHDVEIIPNAVSDGFLDAITAARMPADVAEIPRPILLYVGVLNQWLDTAVLAQVACSRPDWSLVFVGPVESDVGALRRLPNVHLLGPRAHTTLPGYLAAADAGMIPFKISPLTTAVNPVKLYEYFAAGLPVISSALPEVHVHDAVCYIASEHATFLQAAERALAEPPNDPRRGRRRAIARVNTWGQRAAAFERLLATYPSLGQVEADR